MALIQIAALVIIIGLKFAGVVGWGWGPIFGWYLVSMVVGEVLARVIFAAVGRLR
jgi:hypothetical protein